MIADQQRVMNIIFGAMDDINETLPDDKKFTKAMTTELFDPSGRIDSLGVTLFMVSLEQRIGREFNVHLSLSDSGNVFAPDSPFRTVGLLVEHLQGLIETKTNG